jgi:predicted neutral ceramidase superfamily lipid hydrolase
MNKGLQIVRRHGIRFLINLVAGLAFLAAGMGYSPYTNDVSFNNGFSDLMHAAGGLLSFWAWMVATACVAIAIYSLYVLSKNVYDNHPLRRIVHIALAVIAIGVAFFAAFFLYRQAPNGSGVMGLGFLAAVTLLTWVESLKILERPRNTAPSTAIPMGPATTPATPTP